MPGPALDCAAVMMASGGRTLSSFASWLSFTFASAAF